MRNKQVLDLDHDGQAELIVSNYDENTSDPHATWTCSGHWVHQLYRFRDLGAEEIRGRFGGIDFPLIHSWSYGSRCSDPSASHPVEPAQLGDDSTSIHGAVRTRLRTREDHVGLMTIEPVNGCRQIRAGVLVYDRAPQREIAFPNPFTSEAEQLSERIVRAKATVELRGFHKTESGCFANVLWAK